MHTILFKNYYADPGYNTVTRYLDVRKLDGASDTVYFKFCHEAPWDFAKEQPV